MKRLRKKGQRTKKVFPSGKLISVWIKQEADEGWNRDKSVSFEGDTIYVGHGPSRFAVGKTCNHNINGGRFIWLHPVSAHLNHGCYEHGLKSLPLRNENGDNVEMRWDHDARRHVPFNRSVKMLTVFEVPEVPESPKTHGINVKYLKERVNETAEFGRLLYTHRIDYRISDLRLRRNSLHDYCRFFGLDCPDVDISAAEERATARKVAMRIGSRSRRGAS